MHVRGRRGPRRFAEALPSEDGKEHPEEARQHGEGPLAIHGVTRLEAWPFARAFPRERLQQGLVKSKSFPIPRQKVTVSSHILYLIYSRICLS